MFLRQKIFSDEIRNEVQSGHQATFEMKSLDYGNTYNYRRNGNVGSYLEWRSLKKYIYTCMMMMIAFITFKSSLVPLFEGL